MALKQIANDDQGVITPDHELQVMCLLFFIRQFLSLGLATEERINCLEDVVRECTYWTYPVGYHASETLNLIVLEKKSPGHSLRKRCLLNDRRLSPKLIIKRECVAFKDKIHILLNEACPTSYLIDCLLDCERPQDYHEVERLKLLQVLQMLKSSGVPQVVQPVDQGLVSNLSPAPLATIHSSLLKIYEESAGMQEIEKATEHIKQKVTDLWEKMVAVDLPRHRAMKEPIGDFMIARFSPLEFRIIHTEAKWEPRALEVPATEEGPLKQAQYAHCAAEECIRAVLDPSKSLSIRSSSELVRIVLGGGNGTVHYMLLGYVNLVAAGILSGGLMMNVNSSQMVDTHFYILPTGESNLLATYIAEKDLWYDATVYRVINSKLPLVPHISASKPILEKSNRSLEALPSHMFTRQVENYILEAGYVLQITVFDCEVWWFTEDKKKRTKNVSTIPFCVRAEIGGPIEAVQKKAGFHHPCIPSPCQGSPLESRCSQDGSIHESHKSKHGPQHESHSSHSSQHKVFSGFLHRHLHTSHSQKETDSRHEHGHKLFSGFLHKHSSHSQKESDSRPGQESESRRVESEQGSTHSHASSTSTDGSTHSSTKGSSKEKGRPDGSTCLFKDGGSSHDSTAFDKGKKLEVRLVYRPVGWDGTEMPKEELVVSVFALAAVNVPKPKEKRLICNPCDELLTVWMVEEGLSKFKEIDMVNYATTFRTRNLLVQMIDTTKSFHVVLDGEMYGPFNRVRLSPSVHPFYKNAGVKFSVATYWPTQVSRSSF